MKTIVACFACSFCLLFLALPLSAQNNQIYQGFVTGSTKLVETEITALTQANASDLALLEAHYVLLSNTMKDRDKKLFNAYVKQAEKLAKTILEQDEHHVIANALLGGIYGLKIAYKPMSGMFLGSKSASLSASGKTIDPQNPIGWLFFGINKFNTPSMWGGDKQVALESFRKAVTLFESDDVATNWYYLSALAYLGMAQHELNQKEAATQTFQKALDQAPGFMWVRGMCIDCTGSLGSR